MSGVTDLDTLLAGMKPQLSPEDFVYCSIPDGDPADFLHLAPVGLFREEEGLTLILTADAARAAGLAASAPMRRITITIHSSPEAVGLTAAFATALTQDGISANVVAAFYHDHIFVPAADADRAMAALARLSATSGRAE